MVATARRSRFAKVYADNVVVDCLSVMALTPALIKKALDAKVSAIHYTAARSRGDLLTCLRNLADVRETIDANPKTLKLCLTAADIRRAKAEGKLGLVLGLQDPKPIRDDLARLRTLKDLGVRIIQLTQNSQNYIGSGCVEVNDGGLTRFGRQLVAEMNRQGLLVDIGHCGMQTSLDAIRCSAQPVISSHANPRVICASPRNKTDDVIEALAEKGGVMGIASWAPMTYRGNNRRPTIADVMDCFDYALKLAGHDHVALGSDMCEGLYTSRAVWEANHGRRGHSPEVTGWLGNWYTFKTWYAKGLESVSQVPDVAWGLLARGHGAPTVKKVMGGNFLRLFERVCG